MVLSREFMFEFGGGITERGWVFIESIEIREKTGIFV